MKLINDAHNWWRFTSTRVAAFWALLGGAIIAAWPVIQWYLSDILPDGPWRVVLGAAAAFVTFSSFVAARVIQQPELEK